MKKDEPEHVRLHESAALLRGAADDLEGFIADHKMVMRPEDVVLMQKRINEVRRVAGAKLRMARVRQARAMERRTR